MFKEVTVIAFDLDDTLWPCMPTIHRAETTLYGWLEEHYPRITERYNPEQLVECRRDFSGLDPRYRVDMTTMRIDFLRHIGDQHDYDGARLSRNGFEVFFEARQQVEFYDDVLPCLQRLKQRYRLGSITNGNASVRHVGLDHLIEHSVSAADLMVAKPDQLYSGIWLNDSRLQSIVLSTSEIILSMMWPGRFRQASRLSGSIVKTSTGLSICLPRITRLTIFTSLKICSVRKYLLHLILNLLCQQGLGQGSRVDAIGLH